MTRRHRSRPRAATVVAVGVAAMLGACGGEDGTVIVDAAPSDGVPPIDAAPREVISATQSLVPGELVEGIMTGGPSDYAVIHLSAPVSELDWNIHGHADGDTQTVHEQLNQMMVDYVFIPSAPADWWLLLRNSGPTAMDVQLQVELHGNMQWRWQ